MMKTSKKIAPILIVFLLGIFLYPRLQASTSKGDTIQLHEDPYKKQKFSGFIIDASPADRLLYQAQTEIVEEIHAQFVPSSNDNKPDTETTKLKNIPSENCFKSKTISPVTVAGNPECIKNLTNPKK